MEEEEADAASGNGEEMQAAAVSSEPSAADISFTSLQDDKKVTVSDSENIFKFDEVSLYSCIL